MNNVWKVTWVDPPHKDQQVSEVKMVPVSAEEWAEIVAKQKKESKK